jgi:hypothetical protein
MSELVGRAAQRIPLLSKLKSRTTGRIWVLIGYDPNSGRFALESEDKQTHILTTYQV